MASNNDQQTGNKMQTNFNQEAIERFGAEHSDMHNDASNASFDDRMARLALYLDWKLIDEWYLSGLSNETKTELTVLDVGAGKGRMTRKFLDVSKKCVALEPYAKFYHALISNTESSKLETYQCTFSEYCATAAMNFNFVYSSGVTVYLDNGELCNFMDQLCKCLRPDGSIIIRELCHERTTVVNDYSVYRRPADIISVAKSHHLKCINFRRSYPIIVFRSIYDLWPNWLTETLWRITGTEGFWPMWNRLAKLNIPRGGRMCFYTFMFRKQEMLR